MGKRLKKGEKIQGYAEAYGTVVGVIVDIDETSMVDPYRVEIESGAKIWVQECGAKLVPAWQPKVGDRVRVLKKFYENEKLQPGSTGEVTDHYHTTIYGVRIDDFEGQSWAFPADRLEPLHAATPSTITIEAGRYYKTRDGRKVGPVYSENDYYVADAWHYNKNGECGLFGTHNPDEDYRDDKDIVALWEEPASASNDNAAVAKPKFKVGDRVTQPSWGCAATVVECSNSRIDVEDDDGNFASYTSISNFVPATPTTPAIVALIENGTPRPSTAPKVHTSQEAATTEAERLALEHPGQQFGVFVLAESKIADLVTTQTAVLRAA